MKLLLTSKEKFLITKGYDLLGIPKDKLKIGYITTALKVVADTEYLNYMKEYEIEMRKNNISFEEFDIEGKNEEEIREFFKDKNVIQVSGGNPFYLLKSIRESGFDKVLKDLLNEGLIYVGSSAGSYIMCPTIEVAAWKVGRNNYGLNDLTALAYVPFLLKCHYTDSAKDTILEKVKDLKYSLKILRDDQAFLVEDGNVMFIGDGEEVKI
ncbi:MAG: Type 1 glutamine amidotransferase-like domain-containing protein [Patescibacteria group bacterium]